MTEENPAKTPAQQSFGRLFLVNAIGFPPIYFGVSYVADRILGDPFDANASAISAVAIGLFFGLMMAWIGTRKNSAKPS